MSFKKKFLQYHAMLSLTPTSYAHLATDHAGNFGMEWRCAQQDDQECLQFAETLRGHGYTVTLAAREWGYSMRIQHPENPAYQQHLTNLQTELRNLQQHTDLPEFVQAVPSPHSDPNSTPDRHLERLIHQARRHHQQKAS